MGLALQAAELHWSWGQCDSQVATTLPSHDGFRHHIAAWTASCWLEASASDTVHSKGAPTKPWWHASRLLQVCHNLTLTLSVTQDSDCPASALDVFEASSAALLQHRTCHAAISGDHPVTVADLFKPFESTVLGALHSV